MIAIDKGLGMKVGQTEQNCIVNDRYREELLTEDNFLGACNQELLAEELSFSNALAMVIFTEKLFPSTFIDLDS